MIENCVFTNPLYYRKETDEFMPVLGSNIARGDVWNYTNFSCEISTSTADNSLILIKNDTTGAEFYLNKSLNYGDALIIWFLTIFTIVGIFKIAYNFFWKK